MKKMISIWLASVAIAAFGGGSAAADALQTGPYIGANLGWDSSDTSTDTTMTAGSYFAGTSVTSINSQTFELDDDGMNYGAQIGYLWMGDTMGWGIEGDFNLMDRGGADTNTVVYPCCIADTYTYTQEIEQNWIATLRGRVGWNLAGIFAYGTAGVAIADVSYTASFSDTFDPVALQSFTGDDTMFGWTAGIGGEIGLGPATSLKVEYLHTDLGSIDADGTVLTASATDPTLSTSADLSPQLFRVGVNWRL